MKLKKITGKKIPWKNVFLKTKKPPNNNYAFCKHAYITHSINWWHKMIIFIDTLGISHQIYGYK